MKYTPDDIAEIARLTGWHLGTARPAIMPPPKGTELAGWWYDDAGRRVACALTDDLMGRNAVHRGAGAGGCAGAG